MWRFFLGYVIITVEGRSRQSLAESLRRERVPIWNASGNGRGYTVEIPLKKFDQAMDTVKKLGLSVVSVSERGLPKKLRAFFSRGALTIALPMIVFIATVFSMFSWRLDITGIPLKYRDEAMTVMDDIGIEFPLPRKKQLLPVLRDELMLGIPELSWASAEYRGFSLMLFAKEREPIPDTFPSVGYANVVANAGGTIEYIGTLSGCAVVAVGDEVASGDILVSGITGREGFKREVEARAIVIAKTVYTATVELDLGELLRKPTGREYTERYIGVLGFELKLPGDSAEFADLDVTESASAFGGTMFLPMISGVRVYSEYSRDASDEARLRAFQMATGLAEEKALALVREGASIYDTTKNAWTEGGKLFARCDIYAREDIAETVPSGIRQESEQ